MKSIIIILISILSIGLISSCGNQPNKSNNSDTHTHADGTVHQAHTDSDESTPAATQESFKVEADGTTATEEKQPQQKAKHNHDHSSAKHDHDHSHETGHKH